jgi:hypothetical protein
LGLGLRGDCRERSTTLAALQVVVIQAQKISRLVDKSHNADTPMLVRLKAVPGINPCAKRVELVHLFHCAPVQ